jgi:hypothetical protein
MLPDIAAGTDMISGLSRVAASVIFASIAISTNGTAARSQSIDLQEKCAAQAKIAYQQSKLDEQERSTKLGALATGSSGYQSHYNTKLQKCLMLVNQSQVLEGQMSTGATLTDAYDRRVYAVYIWIGQDDNEHQETPPIVCELIPSLADRRDCASREEFDAFAAEYMKE